MTSTTARLRAAGRTPPSDTVLPLASGSLHIQEWLRILPGKRLVGRGEWNGQLVLAKLFVATGAERHWQRESTGIQALQRATIPTPNLLCSGEIPGGGRYLLTDYLTDACSLQQRWDELQSPAPDNPAARAIVESALQHIAAMHAKGLAQTDLHLGNFLHSGAQLYVIDGDAIEAPQPGKSLPLSAAQSNLGLFFAQFLPEWDSQLDKLLPVYLAANPLVGLELQGLLAAIARQRAVRLNNFLTKTLRDCSQFAVSKSASRYCVVLRSEQALLAPLLDDPDSAFGSAPLLKDGGSSTVTRATVGGRGLVIKRYNIKGPGHWLTRFWRPSRAWNAWQAAWRLQFLGIATPQPLAMIERRIGPLRREAWLITDYCPGPDLFEYMGSEGERAPEPAIAQALLRTFAQLVRAKISHGDFKATNLLWHDDQVQLIDLDAMHSHTREIDWHKAWSKDRARFIRNWPDGTILARWLEANLPK